MQIYNITSIIATVLLIVIRLLGYFSAFCFSSRHILSNLITSANKNVLLFHGLPVAAFFLCGLIIFFPDWRIIIIGYISNIRRDQHVFTSFCRFSVRPWQIWRSRFTSAIKFVHGVWYDFLLDLSSSSSSSSATAAHPIIIVSVCAALYIFVFAWCI